MTEQELDQHRADLNQLDVEQLRCGVMLQLSTIEALAAEREALRAELARPESTAVSLMRAENAALKDAARLASRALHRIDAADIRLDTGERLSITKAIAALKAVL